MGLHAVQGKNSPRSLIHRNVIFGTHNGPTRHILASICPRILFVLGGLSTLIPGCNLGGSSGPASGCLVIGISLNGLFTWATVAFVASFFTVPIGLIICLVGIIPTKGRRLD